MRTQTFAVFSVYAAVCSAAVTARAFDYPEHAHITHLAVDLVKADPETMEFLEAGTVALDSRNLCTKDDLFEDQTKACFGIADVPALSGDHAASPLLLKWRWLNDCLVDIPPRGLGAQLTSIVKGLNGGPWSPETALMHGPSIRGMFDLIRTASPSNWPLKDPPSDMKFAQVDDSYVTLGERGHPHFRPRLSMPTASLASARREYSISSTTRRKPVNTAYAWYADLHMGALLYAGHAARALDRDRPTLRATAVLLELSALHYLEDSVAAGHMVGGLDLNNLALMETHNRYGAEGVRAIPPPALCSTIEGHGWSKSLPSLQGACSSGGATTLLGDHQLSKKPKDTPSVTRDWAVALAALSIQELTQAYRTKLSAAPGLAACASRDVHDDPVFTWSPDKTKACGPHSPTGTHDQDLYKCLDAWWEGDAVTSDAVSAGAVDHGALIRQYFDTESFSALRMVPTPVTTDGRPLQGAYEDVTFLGGYYADLTLFGGSTADREVVFGETLGVRLGLPRLTTWFRPELGLGVTALRVAVASPRTVLGATPSARVNVGPVYVGIAGVFGLAAMPEVRANAGYLLDVGVVLTGNTKQAAVAFRINQQSRMPRSLGVAVNLTF